jgi:hypothetical protein
VPRRTMPSALVQRQNACCRTSSILLGKSLASAQNSPKLGHTQALGLLSDKERPTRHQAQGEFLYWQPFRDAEIRHK